MGRTPAGHRQLGPYSRVLRRGAIRDNLDGRSTLGRFVRDMEAQLIAHIGGSPNIVQRLLIDRLVRLKIQLDLFDAKLGSEGWNDHDARTYGGLQNAFRLTAREIGMDQAAVPRFDQVLAELRTEKPGKRAQRASTAPLKASQP